MKRVWKGLALAALALVLTAPAQAQAMGFDYGVSCLKQAELRSYLGRAFNEARVAEGVLENGNRVELFASRTGSWTMVELPGEELACIHSYGHGLKVERLNQLKRPAS